MESGNLNVIINYIVQNCVELKNKYVSEPMNIDYVCIFSQSQEEYDALVELASELGPIVDETKTGPVFKFNKSPQTIAGKPKLLKIRIPDPTRPQRGDVDFNSNYEEFKQKYLDNDKFRLVKSWDGHEMVELKDENYDVLVYFSKEPLGRNLG